MKEYVDMEILRNSVECKYGYDDETDTDLDLEKFDEIYEAVCEGELYFKIEDITDIFKLFIIDDESVAEEMQGFQQDQITQLTVLALRQNDLKKSLFEYAHGLKILFSYMQLHKDYPIYLSEQIKGCLGYLIGERYKIEQLEPFFEEINNYDEEFRMILKEEVKELIERELIESTYEEEFLKNIK